VIIESLSCGTPVIATNKGGIPEAMNSSVGMLVEPTVESLRRSILHFYEHRDELLRMSSNCRPFALSRFSESNAKAIADEYDSNGIT
jgi:glycosyltransferase involved in cell wall biosynthesis